MIISDVMTKDVITVPLGMEVHELAGIFVEKGISGVPVVDENGGFAGLVLEEGLIVRDKKVHLPTFIYMLSGFITFGEHRFEDEMKKMAASTASGIMEKNPVVLSPDTPVEDAATLMVEKGIHYFPVLEGTRLIGVVSRKDIVRAIAQKKIW